MESKTRRVGRVYRVRDKAGRRGSCRQAGSRRPAQCAARGSLSPCPGDRSAARARRPRPGACAISRSMAAIARRGAQGGGARPTGRPRARVPVVPIRRRCADGVRPSRAGARRAHLGGRPAPSRAYHGSAIDRRSTPVQLRRRSRSCNTSLVSRRRRRRPTPSSRRIRTRPSRPRPPAFRRQGRTPQATATGRRLQPARRRRLCRLQRRRPPTTHPPRRSCTWR